MKSFIKGSFSGLFRNIFRPADDRSTGDESSGFPNAASIEDTTSPVYFLHIPKTGGTTFLNFLISQFGNNDVCPAHLWRNLLEIPPERVAEYSLIWGHFYSYLYRYVSNQMRYVTILRDPVERALSHYGHIMLHKEHYLHARAKELGDFSAYLRDPEMATTLANFQVMSLALDLDPVATASALSADQLASLELERRLETARSSATAEDMLGVAKRRLRQMHFVGITERLDESVALLCEKFHWQRPEHVESHNVNGNRLRSEGVSKTDLALLRKINEADYQLYEFANQLFLDDLNRAASIR
jgi:Sulfotransferase family